MVRPLRIAPAAALAATLALLVATRVPAAAVPASQQRVLVEAHAGVPAAWRHVARAAPDAPLALTIAVRQTNTALLEQTLLRVSDPDHADFNKLLTSEQVHEMVAPRPGSVAAVRALLSSHGIDSSQAAASPNWDLISVDTTVAAAERLLGAQYHTYTHGDATITRLSGPYSLPADVAPHVDFVGPTVRFPAPGSALTVHARRPHGAAIAGDELASDIGNDGGGIVPATLRELYNVGNTTGTAPGNLQGVSSFLREYYSPDDLQSFFAQLFPSAKGRVPALDGPNDPGTPGTEASLDIEYIMAMGAGVPTVYWSTAGTQPGNKDNEPFLLWLQNISSTPDAQQPKTMSASYGDNENTVNVAYARRVNAEFQKAGLRGISLFFSSGDGGVSGSHSTQCKNGRFIPTFPSASPWVTAVGGTTGTDPETGAHLSGGGFSDYWQRPSWQDAAVHGYLSSGVALPSSGAFNHSGAGFPDVSAQAEGFTIVAGGQTFPVSGTSCSSPTFAGIVSLVNDARMAAGKGPLGFLNQVLYKRATATSGAFTDIVSGNNPGCGTDGFACARGWDPVTGLGTPNFEKLRDIAMGLP